MSAMEPLCLLLGIPSKQLSKEENYILEAELFLYISEQLIELFKDKYYKFFKLMKFNKSMEEEMLEQNFIQLIINDILSSNEYTLEGIANYTAIHIDIIQELASGLNTKPLAIYFRKIIELHRSVRRDLYHEIGKKIAIKYLTAA